MQFRMSFIFQFGNAGWTENWYRVADTPERATFVTAAQWQLYMYGRADGCMLRAIRANKVGDPRVTHLRIMNKIVGVAPGAPALGGEPPGVALQCLVQATDFHSRTASFRGMNDLDIERGPNGFPIWNGAILQDVLSMASSLVSIGAQIQVLRKDPVGNPYRTITQFQKGNDAAETTAIQYAGLAIPAGSKVLVSGISRRTWPGLQGPLPLIAAAEDSLILPVLWRQPVATVPGNGAKIRIVQYDYPLVQDLFPEDVRTRRVGRPLGGYRGRRSGQRYRSH